MVVMSEFTRDPQTMAVVASTAAVISDGYEGATYWHINHAPCPLTGDDSPVVLYAPLDKTGWSGASCGMCEQSLQAF